MACDTVLQWNCRGFQANFNELQILKQDFNPVAYCLQETYLKETTNIDFRQYNTYHKSVDAQRASGGSAILVKNNVIHSQIPLKLLFKQLLSV